MRKPIIAGNWKMNKTVAEAVALINDIGVKIITTNAILQFRTSIITSVASMVTTPLTKLVKPVNKPSDISVTSVTIFDIISPLGWASIYDNGALFSLFTQSLRMPFTVKQASFWVR